MRGNEQTDLLRLPISRFRCMALAAATPQEHNMNPLSTFSRSRLALLCGSLLTLMAGCGGGLDPILGSPGVGIAPTVTATSPAARTPVVTGVATNSRVTATFSKPMAPATLVSSFTLACPAGTPWRRQSPTTHLRKRPP